MNPIVLFNCTVFSLELVWRTEGGMKDCYEFLMCVHPFPFCTALVNFFGYMCTWLVIHQASSMTKLYVTHVVDVKKLTSSR